MGSDMILTVAPGKLALYVADAEVIDQVTTRRNDFPKPLEMYGRLNIYGKNVVSTEGATWRQHRKITAPSFTEKNNDLVFSETLHHGQALVRLWTGKSGTESRTIQNASSDTMRFALYIISSAGFAVRVLWAHEEAEKQGDIDAVGSTPPPGHQLSYKDAITDLLENIMWTQVFPPWLLSKPSLCNTSPICLFSFRKFTVPMAQESLHCRQGMGHVHGRHVRSQKARGCLGAV
jgi:hypothetical protein